MVVSVIIPVYNVAPYLDECIHSVITQSYNNLEIILVNDGSTDESGALCDAWAEKDSRIHVIHKENGGLSDARNAGIDMATGEYVLFLDSDDFWDDAHAVQRLADRVKKTDADVIHYSYKKFDEETTRALPYFHEVDNMPLGLSKKEQLRYLTRNGLYIASACNKLIKRSLLDETLFFRKGVYSEDIEWCALLMNKAKSLDFVYENFYCYRQREGSIRHLYHDKKCVDLAKNIIRCFDCIDVADAETKEALMIYTAYQFSTFFMVQALAENYQKKAIADLKTRKWILAYHGGNRKVKLLHRCCSLIGYTATCRLLRFLYTPKRK